MLESIRIKNFQSHKDTEINFEPGVNVIIGPSDSGKSAIIRAFKWLKDNRPLGDAFRSHWGGDTSVRFSFADCDIERFKGSNDFYRLWSDQNKEPLEFTAFGTSVPDEIQEALNLTDLNVQNQMDSAFLISNNPGEVSRHFNKIARIDLIDISLKNVESQTRKLNQSITATEEEIERQKAELKQYDYIDQLEQDLEVLEQLDSQAKQKKQQRHRLSESLAKLKSVNEQIKEARIKVQPQDDVNGLINLIESRDKILNEAGDLERLIKKERTYSEEIEVSSELLSDEKLVDAVLGLYNKAQSIKSKTQKLKKLIDNEQNLDSQILRAEGMLEDLENEWHENAPDVCPLCDQVMA